LCFWTSSALISQLENSRYYVKSVRKFLQKKSKKTMSAETFHIDKKKIKIEYFLFLDFLGSYFTTGKFLILCQKRPEITFHIDKK
jgi:hypothetical protein